MNHSAQRYQACVTEGTRAWTLGQLREICREPFHGQHCPLGASARKCGVCCLLFSERKGQLGEALGR